MTPREYHFAMDDFQEREMAKADNITKSIFESMRIQTMWINNMNPYIKKRIRKPTDMMTFAWDKEGKTQTQDEIKSRLLSFVKRHNRRIKKEKI